MASLMTVLSRAAMSMALCASLSAAMPALARQWHPDPRGAAADYTQILHAKPTGEFVFLWWAVPESFANDANSQVIKDVLGRYVVIGVAHGRGGNAPGQLAFDTIPDIKVADSMSRQLTPVPPAAMAPEVAQALNALQAMQSPMRLGMRWFVFNGGSVHSCAAGKISVPFSGETYTFDTPIPGCA